MKILNAFAILALLATIVAAVVINAHTIEHVYVIMLENRAFDQVYGLYPGVNGVNLPGNKEGKPATCNYINTTDHSKGKICSSDDAFPVARCDPNHDSWAQDRKVFGDEAFYSTPRNFTTPVMDSFVEVEGQLYHAHEGDYCDVMKVFNRKTLPIHYAFADHGAIFNEFYCAMNGPTWPNRLFTLLGGSFGLTETSIPWYLNTTGALYPQKSIIDQVLKAGLSAQVIVNDTTWESMIGTIAHNPEIIKLSSDFMDDLKKGENLPNFAWINPRAGVDVNNGHGSQDFHPDHPSWEAETYIKDLYEAVLASPKVNSSVLIVTYDENGGFFDHVPTPLNVPRPDDTPSWPDAYKEFNRLGIRIPTMLISPWIPNMIINDPPTSHPSKPDPNSKFELTSIMGTVRRILNIPDDNLTARDAFAARFDYLLNILDEPRTDLPKHLPEVFKPAEIANYCRIYYWRNDFTLRYFK